MRFTVACLLALSACTPIDQPISTFAGPALPKETASTSLEIAVPPSAPIIWRVDPDCLANEAKSPVSPGTPWSVARVAVQGRCLQDSQRDFVAIGISGGGTKAAIFGAESMFFLDAIGLLKHTALISSVSGGSFAASYYALSCRVGREGLSARVARRA